MGWATRTVCGTGCRAPARVAARRAHGHDSWRRLVRWHIATGWVLGHLRRTECDLGRLFRRRVLGIVCVARFLHFALVFAFFRAQSSLFFHGNHTWESESRCKGEENVCVWIEWLEESVDFLIGGLDDREREAF